MASLQQAKFCDLGDFSHESTLKDDYKKKFGAIGFKASTAKNASFRYKKSVALKVNEAKKERPELSDEFTVGFPYKQYFLQARVNRNSQVKLHVDAGEHDLGKKVNLYGNIKTQLNLANYAWRFGVNYFGKKCESSNQLEKDQSDQHLFLHRTVCNYDKLKFGFVAAANLEFFKVCKYDAFLNYANPEWDFSLIHNSPALSPHGEQEALKLGSLLGAFTYKINDKQTVSVAVKNNFEAGNKARVVLGGVAKVNDKLTARAKVDQAFKFSTAGKYKLNNMVTLGASASLRLAEGSKAVDFTKALPFPLGWSVDVAI